MRAIRYLPLLWASLAWGQDDADTSSSEATDTEAADTVAAPDPVDQMSDDLAAFRAELDALRKQVSEQEARLAKQDSELAKQRKGLTDVRLKAAGEDNFKVTVSGYYRARAHVFGAGDAGPDGAEVAGRLYQDQPTTGQYLNQRIRMGLKFAYKDVASLNIHAMALDNVIWGDNADVSTTALFAGDPSYTQITGLEAPPIEIFRGWMEFKIPVGLFRVGRQSSHWGLGILANDGDGFRNDFGEAYTGATFDRILFATNPVSLIQAFTKKKETKEIPLIFAVAFDKLVSDPLSQYYGYKCSPGVDQTVDPGRYDARCDIDGDGITDADHSYKEERDPDRRRDGWWADQRDDVNEMVYALIYRGKDVKYFGGTGDLTAGMYLIHRWQTETDSSVIIPDVYLDAKVHGVSLQFEGLGIFGDTRAITLPDSATPEDPLFKTAQIGAYVARVGYERDWFKVEFESGMASGDNQVNDALFTGRSFDPNYNVGLILFEEVIKQVTDELWAGSASGLRSKGGVYNAHYINPRVKFYPYNNTEIIAGFMMAWPDQADGAVYRCNEADAERFGCSAGDNIANELGWELDLAIKHRFQKHILVSIETAYAHATNRLPLDVVGLNTDGNFWTFQARAAWEF